MNFERLKKIKEEKDYRVLDICPWQYIELHEIMWEWNNQRIWKFKWMVLKVRRPNSPEWTFTIRGKVAGITVEKIYPLSFNNFQKVYVIEEHRTRRSKLYYLREKIGRQAKLKRSKKNVYKEQDLLKTE